MNRRAVWNLGLALLASLPALSLSGCSSRSSEAEIRYDYGDYRFTSEPRMRLVTDNGVYYIRDASDYDVYQFEGTWYLNDRGSWYRAGSWRGPFVSMEVDVLPHEIATVPSDYRRNWVAVRRDYRNRDLPDGYWASGRTFSEKPSMRRIPNTAVTFARRAVDYDLYRHRGTWYLVDDGYWYRSSSWRGPFLSIRASSVPNEVLSIPQRYRRDWAAPATYRDDDRRPTIRYWSSGRTFTAQPQTYAIPRTSVYYVSSNDGYDLYRFGNAWYLADEGGWYRADTWRGPYISVQVGAVPRAVLTVPISYRRYWTSD